MEKIFIYVRGGVVVSVANEYGQEVPNGAYEIFDYDDMQEE